MKILYVVETFTSGLGYIDNILPLELGKLDNQVKIITAGLPPYAENKENHFGSPSERKNLLEDYDENVSIEYLEHYNFNNRVVFKNILSTFRHFSPDVVMVRGLSSLVLLQVVLLKLFFSFKLFTSTGMAYSAVDNRLKNGNFFSIYRLKNFLSKKILGFFLSLFINKCIASTTDGELVANQFYGVLKPKLTTISLGVDTRKFYPVRLPKDRESRLYLRSSLGIAEDEIVCIWTGRMTKGKHIELLAQAVDALNAEGFKCRALFIGDGPEKETLKTYKYSIVLPFMLWKDLPDYYRAADIAVWPKSITTSTLDASACGLPIIMSNTEQAQERWQDMGLSYDNHLSDLKEKIKNYFDAGFREKHSQTASERMQSQYSWSVIARKFNKLFEEA